MALRRKTEQVGDFAHGVRARKHGFRRLQLPSRHIARHAAPHALSEQQREIIPRKPAIRRKLGQRDLAVQIAADVVETLPHGRRNIRRSTLLPHAFRKFARSAHQEGHDLLSPFHAVHPPYALVAEIEGFLLVQTARYRIAAGERDAAHGKIFHLRERIRGHTADHYPLREIVVEKPFHALRVPRPDAGVKHLFRLVRGVRHPRLSLCEGGISARGGDLYLIRQSVHISLPCLSEITRSGRGTILFGAFAQPELADIPMQDLNTILAHLP